MESARTEFLSWNQDTMLRREGIEFTNDFIYIDFFGERYSINRLTGVVLRFADNASAGFSTIMSIYDVLCYSKPDAVLSRQWQSLANLSPHSNFGSSDRNSFGAEATKFSGKIEELKNACITLGGLETTKADIGFMFNAFPFLPIVFQFWEGDDEFPPKINVLFDRNTLDYIHFETAWYVAGHLLRLIETIMNG